MVMDDAARSERAFKAVACVSALDPIADDAVDAAAPAAASAERVAADHLWRRWGWGGDRSGSACAIERPGGGEHRHAHDADGEAGHEPVAVDLIGALGDVADKGSFGVCVGEQFGVDLAA